MPLAMPEYDDSSILGESVYQHIPGDNRDMDNAPVDMKMFEHHYEINNDREPQQQGEKTQVEGF